MSNLLLDDDERLHLQIQQAKRVVRIQNEIIEGTKEKLNFLFRECEKNGHIVINGVCLVCGKVMNIDSL